MQNGASDLVWRGFRWLARRAVSPLPSNRSRIAARPLAHMRNSLSNLVGLGCEGFRPRAPIAIVLYIREGGDWDSFSNTISTLDQNFDLFVALVSGSSDHLAEAIRQAYSYAYIFVVDSDSGRALRQLVRTGTVFEYELICVLNGDRNASYGWQRSNRISSLNIGVLGSCNLMRKIVSAYRANSNLGIVVSKEDLAWRSFSRGSSFWIRPFLLRSVKDLGFHLDDSGPQCPHAIEQTLADTCVEAGMTIADTGCLPEPAPARCVKVHVIANYLPQFHPIPENDAWWEPGFTEWTNVVRATPQFNGHRQPRLPADLGFYDLRLAEVRSAQAKLAATYGVTAFSYYYYWFNGRKLLSRPLDEVLTSGRPDFPFMICWANEPWTRSWDGLSNEVLLPQNYHPGWEALLVRDIAPILADPRYLRLNGRPVLAIYRVMHLPNPKEAIRRLRAFLAERGLPAVHIIAGKVQFEGDAALPQRPEDLELDAHFEFPPHGILGKCPWRGALLGKSEDFTGSVYDYGAIVDAVIGGFSNVTAPRYRGVMTAWDNTARRSTEAVLFHGATPARFRRWLRAATVQARAEAWAPETAVFINAWNEWGEGAYLEPDRDFGHGWLEAVASATEP